MLILMVCGAISLSLLSTHIKSHIALDLLNKMLVYPPEKRITVTEALAHPFFGILHDEEDEPSATSTVTDDWEGARTLEEYRGASLAW